MMVAKHDVKLIASPNAAHFVGDMCSDSMGFSLAKANGNSGTTAQRLPSKQ